LRKLAALITLILIVLSLLLVTPVFAEDDVTLYAKSVKNLEAVHNDDETVTLYWESELTTAQLLVTQTITISVGTSYDSSEVEKIKELNVNSIYSKLDDGGLQSFSSTIDFDPDKYKYVKVSCGNTLGKWMKAIPKSQAQIDAESAGSNEYEDNISWPERLAATIVAAIPNYVAQEIGLEDPLELIYQTKVDESKSLGAGDDGQDSSQNEGGIDEFTFKTPAVVEAAEEEEGNEEEEENRRERI